MGVLGIEEPQNHYSNFHNRKPLMASDTTHVYSLRAGLDYSSSSEKGLLWCNTT